MSNYDEASNNDQQQDSRVEEAVGDFLKNVLLAPASLLSWLLLKHYKQPLGSIFGITLVIEAVLYGVWLLLGLPPKVLFLPTSWTVAEVAPAAILLYLFVTVPLTVMVASGEVGALKKDLKRVNLNNGDWAYGFRYRRTPLGWWRRGSKVRSLLKGRFGDETTALGIEEKVYGADSSPLDKVRDRITQRYVAEAGTHTLLFGGTGSGKTVTMFQLIRGDMMNHRSVLVLDFKGDPEVAQRLANWSEELGTNFYHFDRSTNYSIVGGNQCYWDPFAQADAMSRPSRVEALRKWDTASEHYRTTWDSISSTVFALLDKVKAGPTTEKTVKDLCLGQGQLKEFQAVVAHGDEGLSALKNALAGRGAAHDEAKKFQESLSKDAGAKHEMKGIGNRLASLDHKGYGPWMRASGDPARDIDLLRLLNEPGNVICFSVEALNNPEMAGGIGAMLLAELDSVASKRTNRATNDVAIYIDEAQNIVPEKLLGIFAMARASRMGMTIAQQTMEQFEATSASGATFRKLLFNIIDNFIIQAGSAYDTGEAFANLAGKETSTKVRGTSGGAGQSGGMGYGDEDDWVVNPSEFVKLKKPTPPAEPGVVGRIFPRLEQWRLSRSTGTSAQAIVINKRCLDPVYKTHVGPLARKVWMVPVPEAMEKLVIETHVEPPLVDRAPEVEVRETSMPDLLPEVRVEAQVAQEEVQAPTVEAPQVEVPAVPTYHAQVRGRLKEMKEGVITKEEFSTWFRALTGLEATAETLRAYMKPLPHGVKTPAQERAEAVQAVRREYGASDALPSIEELGLPPVRLPHKEFHMDED